METRFVLGIIAACVVILGGGLYIVSATNDSSGGGQSASTAELREFAQCLSEEDVTFYGAFWCPHCQDQKAMFGDAAEALPYTECSTPDGNSMTQACREADISSYPTWEFGDGSRETGVLSLQALAEKSSCAMPSGQ